MPALLRLLLMALLLCLPAHAQAQNRPLNDCDCPKISCHATCEVETEVKFYSEKCAGGERMRSCAKPTCVKVDPLPASCPVPVADTVSANRGIASIPEKLIPAKSPKVGVVEKLVGRAWLVKADAQTEPLSEGAIVSEKDIIETAPDGRLEIRFDDGNFVLLGGGSRIDLKKVELSDKPEKSKTTLELLKGKVRSRVTKTDLSTSHFQVKTRSAVAGVRGTDFVVSLEERSDTDELITRVETLTGQVELISADNSDKALISASEAASYVIQGFSARTEIDGLAMKGRMTPVTKLSPAEIAAIDGDLSTEPKFVAEKRSISSEKQDVKSTCESPRADFNQCSWTCVNNPKGEKTCRTDLPTVQCVRKLCKANGKWSDQLRLPASFGLSCDPDKVVVAPCDY